MRGYVICAVALIVAAILTACASAVGPSQSVRDGAPGAAGPATPKTLTVALQGEPQNIMTILGGDVGGSPAERISDAVHQHMMVYDYRGEVQPMLLTELPSQSRGTWVVRPNGTMQTTYRLRPGVTWHDGTPFTARDVVFGWTVSTDPELPVRSRRVASQITHIEAEDELTVVAEWSRVSPFADLIVNWDLGPLPAHLLDHTYEADKSQFERLPYWNREFVGLGPYVLAEWSLGSHLVANAYEGFFRGRPKIDSFVFKFIPNEPTVVASLLAGAVDGQFRAVAFNQAMFVKTEWERAGKTPVAIGQPTTWRVMEFQYRDQARDSRLGDLTDVRVRRALLHAIDRRAMVEHLYEGHAPVADTFISPQDVKWDWVKDSVVPYEADPRRAQQLLGEVGWRHGADGMYVNAAAEKVTIPFSTTEGGQWQDEMAIVADEWKAIGLDVAQDVIPTAQSRDRRLRASFPGVSTTSAAPILIEIVRTFHGADCPGEETRWVGTNRGCYQGPAADRVIDALSTAIDPPNQRRLAQEAVRLHGEDLPGLPLYFTIQIILFREGVTGVKGGSRPSGGDTWNIYEWDLQPGR